MDDVWSVSKGRSPPSVIGKHKTFFLGIESLHVFVQVRPLTVSNLSIINLRSRLTRHLVTRNTEELRGRQKYNGLHCTKLSPLRVLNQHHRVVVENSLYI